MRTKRKPESPHSTAPSHGSVSVKSRTAWSFEAPFTPSMSHIASLTDSPKRIRTRTGVLSAGMPVTMRSPPCSSRPKSSSRPGRAAAVAAEHADAGVLQVGLPVTGFEQQVAARDQVGVLLARRCAREGK